MKAALCAASILVALARVPAPLAAIDLDVTPADIERALAIARSTDVERARFHAPYIVEMNTSAIERIEAITELRRVVLLAEDRIRKGDRGFSYSVSQAQYAASPWKRRVAIVARMRFHPQNNYVGVPNVDLSLEGANGVPIGVLKEPILSLPSGVAGERLPVLGAVVEGVFDATTVGQTTREVVVRLEKKEVARRRIDLGRID